MNTFFLILTLLVADSDPGWHAPTGFKTWNGYFSSQWGNDGNWDCPFVPAGPDEDVCFGHHFSWIPDRPTINVGAEPRTIGEILIFPDYPVTFTGVGLTCRSISGEGSLSVRTTLTAESIRLDTLAIGAKPGSDVPEPSAWWILAELLFIIHAAAFLIWAYRQ